MAADPALSAPALETLTGAKPGGGPAEHELVLDDPPRYPLTAAAAAIAAAAETQAAILAALPDD
jgi:hypothetical protein